MSTIKITAAQKEIIEQFKKELDQRRPELLQRLRKSDLELLELAVNVLTLQQSIIYVYEGRFFSAELLSEFNHELINKFYAEARQ